MSPPLKTKKSRLHTAAVEAPMPSSVDPMLPTPVKKPFSGSDWLFEPKWDGWRTMCFVRDGKAHLISRKKNSLSERFPELRDIAKTINAKTAVIDGEIVALDQEGLPSFDGLRSRKDRSCSVVFYAFDLLYLDGFNITGCPLVKRKELLRKILPKDNTGRVRFTDYISGSGERLFDKLEELKLEGMVMKRKESVYSFSRCRDWLKVKTSAGRITMQKRIEGWK